MKQRGLVVLLVAAACGKVNETKIDATVGDDGGGQDDAMSDAPAGPTVVSAVSARGVSNFAVPDATLTKVQYNAEVYDDESEFDPTTNRFTAKVAGDYLVCAGLSVNATGYPYELDVYLNSARLRVLGIGEDVARGCSVVRMAANDHLEIWMYQNTGNTINVTQDLVWDWLTIGRIDSPSVAAATQASFDATNNTLTPLPYTNEQRDELNGYDTGTLAFTAAQAGDYLSCASVSTNAAFFGQLHTAKNGTPVVMFGRQIGAANGCRTTRMAANDTVQVQFLQANGGTRTIPHNAFWNWMSLHRVPAMTQLNTISNVTLPQGTHTKIPYTSEEFDTGAQFDVGTNTFTAAVAGDYLVCLSLHAGGLEFVETDLFKNGQQLMGISHGKIRANGCHIVRLAQGDQIDIRGYQAGAALAITPDATYDWLQISKLK